MGSSGMTVNGMTTTTMTGPMPIGGMGLGINPIPPGGFTPGSPIGTPLTWANGTPIGFVFPKRKAHVLLDQSEIDAAVAQSLIEEGVVNGTIPPVKPSVNDTLTRMNCEWTPWTGCSANATGTNGTTTRKLITLGNPACQKEVLERACSHSDDVDPRPPCLPCISASQDTDCAVSSVYGPCVAGWQYQIVTKYATGNGKPCPPPDAMRRACNVTTAAAAAAAANSTSPNSTAGGAAVPTSPATIGPTMDCAVTDWGACTGGERQRSITRHASGSGKPCPALKEACTAPTDVLSKIAAVDHGKKSAPNKAAGDLAGALTAAERNGVKADRIDDTTAPGGGVDVHPTAGATVTGRYGSLKLAADGTWTYDVDTANMSVQMYGKRPNTLADVFSVTMSQGGMTRKVSVMVKVWEHTA